MFQRAGAAHQVPESVLRAEQSLMAETLLLASTNLLSNPDAKAAIEYMCESMIAATPHIPVVWAWFGSRRVDAIQPQIAVGLPPDLHAPLLFERVDVSGTSPGDSAVQKQPTRAFDVSNQSESLAFLQLAQLRSVRALLVVPISQGGDERGMLGVFSTRPKYFAAVNHGLFETLGAWSHTVLTQSTQRTALDNEVHRDAVTGLISRRQAQRLLDEVWRAPPRHDNRGVLMLINIDEFAKLNATCGARVGDLTLHHLARVLEKNLRRSDVVARWGGGEFLAWLPAVSGAAALATAEQLRNSVNNSPPDALEGWPLGLSVSLGATPVPASDTFAVALDRASRPLSSAKRLSHDRVVVARPGA